MSRKCLVEREKKRKKLVHKYFIIRNNLKCQIKRNIFLEKKFNLHSKLQQLPRDSSKTRLHNRCFISGRSRGFFRDFGISRHFIREFAHEGFLPGIKKASW